MKKITFCFFGIIFLIARTQAQPPGCIQNCSDQFGNTMYGYFAGGSNLTQYYVFGNTLLGHQAGTSINDDYVNHNTLIGFNAGANTTTGVANTFLGSEAGVWNEIGAYNTFIGKDAGHDNITGGGNTFLGSGSGAYNITGYANVFIGSGTGRSNTVGVRNTFVGSSAGWNNLEGERNTTIGYESGYNNKMGYANVFLGFRAGYNEVNSNRLYIANDSTSNPLIYGEFDNQIFSVNGALGVGTKNPERPIHLRAKNAILRIDRDRDDPGFAIVRYDSGFKEVWKSFYFYTRGDGPNDGKFIIADWEQNVAGASTARLVVANNGNVGIGDYLYTNPSQKLTVNGNVLATGSFITSDKRFKKNIKTLPRALEKLNSLRGVEYELDTQKFKERGFPQGQSIGLIAQEIEKVFPELVLTDNEGYKSVNYDGLIPVLIEALKEETQKRQYLETRLEKLENKLSQTGFEDDKDSPKLFQNKPNPFNQSTLILYQIPEDTYSAMILITDLQGKEISRLPIQIFGEGSLSLESGSLTKGIYLYTLIVDGKIIDTKQMFLN